jgi:hypothetical protein
MSLKRRGSRHCIRALALLLLVITVVPAHAWPDEEFRRAFTGVTIDTYGPMPGSGSGVFMVLRVAHATTAQGEKRNFYFIHAGDDRFLGDGGAQAYPAPGARCDLTTVTRHVSGDLSGTYSGDGGPQDPIGHVIEDIRC